MKHIARETMLLVFKFGNGDYVCQLHYLLEVVFPVWYTVRLGELDGHAAAVGDVGGEASQRLSAAAAHAQQKDVAARLAQYPRDAEQMFDGIHEEHYVQWRAVHL